MKLAGTKAKVKSIDYRHYVALGITLLFCLLGAFVYCNSYIRLYEALGDFLGALSFYFKFLFIGGNANSELSILNSSAVKYPLEIAFEELKHYLVSFCDLFVARDNFLSYLSTLFKILFFVFSFGGVFALLIYIFIKIFIWSFYLSNDKGIYEASKPLKAYLFIDKKIIHPCKTWIKSFIDFLTYSKNYLKIWLIIWLLNLNVSSIALAVVGYLLYFAVSYNIGTVFFQVYKLILDLSLMFGGLPLIFWIIIAACLFHYWRKKLAIRRLQGMEQSNREFIDSLPISNLIVGSMGSQKTTLITDMALSQRDIFRDKSFEILREHELRFPNYPWLDFIRRFCLVIESGDIKSLSEIPAYVDKEFTSQLRISENKKYVERHNRRHSRRAIDMVPYDFDLYNTKFDTGLDVYSLKDSMISYAKAFYVYICPNYNFSNYSIRFDDILQSVGNFPLWDNDYHNRKSSEIDLISRYAKILNFDWLRLGSKVNENVKELFEFGIITITEIGKDRGNQKSDDLIKKKMGKDFLLESNPLTDNFNDGIKMIRHPSTIDFYPFVKLFCDEQRADSLGADMRELGNIISIEEKSGKSLSLVLFGLEDRVIDFVLRKYTDLFYKYVFYRSDRCLREKLLKDFSSFLYAYQLRIYNKYGFVKLKLAVENGKRDGPVKNYDYYLSFKKIYSRRFSTDCYSEFYRDMLRYSKRGIYQYEEYSGIRMTFEEIEKQNSYWGKRLAKNFRKAKEKV